MITMFEADPSVGSEFIKLDNTTREVSITPDATSAQHVGVFTVKVTVSDVRTVGALTTEYTFKVTVKARPNDNVPSMDKPKDVFMLVNETVQVQLGAIEDKDQHDKPIISTFTASDKGEDFIKLDNSTRIITVTPGNKTEYVGEYRVSIVLDDQNV